HFMVQYMIVASCGLLVAFLLFKIGGSFAQVTGQENSVIGVSFEAGGAFAGFLLVFLLSVPVISKLRKMDQREWQHRQELERREQQFRQELEQRDKSIHLRVHLEGQPKFRPGFNYLC